MLLCGKACHLGLQRLLRPEGRPRTQSSRSVRKQFLEWPQWGLWRLSEEECILNFCVHNLSVWDFRLILQGSYVAVTAFFHRGFYCIIFLAKIWQWNWSNMAEQKVCLVQGLETYLSKKWVQESKMHPTFALKVFEIKTHINKKVLQEMKNISSKRLNRRPM